MHAAAALDVEVSAEKGGLLQRLKVHQGPRLPAPAAAVQPVRLQNGACKSRAPCLYACVRTWGLVSQCHRVHEPLGPLTHERSNKMIRIESSAPAAASVPPAREARAVSPRRSCSHDHAKGALTGSLCATQSAGRTLDQAEATSWYQVMACFQRWAARGAQQGSGRHP